MGWELRVATSLAPFWLDGRDAVPDFARGDLQRVREGLDTADLQGAKALLDQL
jgi:hypothetical protein